MGNGHFVRSLDLLLRGIDHNQEAARTKHQVPGIAAGLHAVTELASVRGDGQFGVLDAEFHGFTLPRQSETVVN
jgi:hypothetical protein